MTESENVSFGFKQVSPDEKTVMVGRVFRSVAGRYDVMNDIMSAGAHRLWKHDTINRINPQPGERCLDVAGGTGGLARAFLEQADRAGRRRNSPRQATAIICDINEAMLKAGRAHSGANKWQGRLGWICGDGTRLPFPDNSFDVITVGFGIRNFTDRQAGLGEFYRVLRPGGRIGILEFSQMSVPALQSLYDAYSFRMIPFIGRLVTGDRASYQYLVESIRRFPSQAAFQAEMEQAGFANVSVHPFFAGIAALHMAWII